MAHFMHYSIVQLGQIPGFVPKYLDPRKIKLIDLVIITIAFGQAKDIIALGFSRLIMISLQTMSA